MYNPTLLRAGFVNLVGILNANLPQIPKLTPALTTSNTGIYVQDKHPLLSLENIFYSAPDFTWTNWTLWVSLSPYVIGSQVGWAGQIYICTVNVTSATNPASDGAHWNVYNPFQVWCQQKYNQAVTNLFAKIVEKKKLKGSVKAIMERQELFRGGGSLNNTIINSGAAVGFEIYILQAEGLKAFIDAIGFQATEAQSDMNFYLYNSDTKNYIGIWTSDLDGSYTFQWINSVQPNGEMEYDKFNAVGCYWFVYYQDDLKGQAIAKKWDCSASPCYECTGLDLSMYNKWSRWINMKNVMIPASALNEDRTLFDASKIVYNTTTNWGLNLRLSVRCDLTNFILYSKEFYADVFAYQLAKEFLTAIGSNSRINPTNNQIQLDARADLDMKFPGAWINQYNDAIDALNIDMSNFSDICMPCEDNKKKRLKFSSI